MQTSVLAYALLLSGCLGAATPRSIYQGLNPRSLSQHLTFYHLYPDCSEGKQALEDAWGLLGGGDGNLSSLPALAEAIPALLDLLQGREGSIPKLPESALNLTDRLGQDLCNRTLPGYGAGKLEDFASLQDAHFDVTRALLLSQVEDLHAIRSYEALLDLLALEIQGRLEGDRQAVSVVKVINQILFHDLYFRFPPLSSYADDIDLYTFLPSVLDGRRGVCLGLSTLYICLGQRLGIELELITPPGHIYVRAQSDEQTINIETTARGVHMDSQVYLGVNTRKLQQRSLWELLSMAHFNRAGLCWRDGNFSQACAAYEEALRLSPGDPQIMEFLGYAYACCGREDEGKHLLEQIVSHLSEHAVTGNNLAEDYLNKHVNAAGIAAVLMHVDETRTSIERKQAELKEILRDFPQFRAGWQQLAITYLQLHREREALAALENYHGLDPSDVCVEYYLAVLNTKRLDYPAAWRHLDYAQALAEARAHKPKALRDLQRHLSKQSPRILQDR